MKKILRSIVIAILLVLYPLVVLAAVSDITTMVANPSNTFITLTWIKTVDSNTTVIRYRTDAYPTSPTNGVLAYNGTGFQTTIGNNITGEHLFGDNISALTAGQTYYFAAWGQNGSTYSTNSFNLTMNTLAVALATGGATPQTVTVPTATMPNEMTQAPSNSGFNLAPFDGIIAYFNNASGGLGMPINNAWETLAIIGIVGSGVLTYTKVRNFFTAFAVAFVLTLFGVSLHLVQGWLFGIEIVLGMGVWAVDHYLQ